MTKEFAPRLALSEGSLIDDLPDSPLSCAEDHRPCWVKAEDAVLWSNAAFRSDDMADDDTSSSSTRTSLSSTRSNEGWKGLSTSNCVYRDGMDDEHANTGRVARNVSRPLNSESIEKPRPCACHALVTPLVIAVNVSVGGLMAAQGCHTIYHVDGNPRWDGINLHCECQAPGEEIQSSSAGKSNSPSGKGKILLEGFPGPRSVEKGKDEMREKSQIYVNGPEISEEEAKIKAELENEIEKGLEKEIKDGICELTRRLAELHARQRARTGDAQKPNSGTTMAENTNAGDNARVDMTTGRGSELGILWPRDVPTTPPISSFRHRELSPGVNSGGKDFRSGGKISGGGKSWEKKNRKAIFEKDFDWVRTLRSGTTSPPEFNKCGRHNYTVAAPERLCNDPTVNARGCSRALFMERSIPFNSSEEGSKSEPRRCRRHGCSHYSKDDNAIHLVLRDCGKHRDKISPMDDDSCRRKYGTDSGVLNRMGNRKGGTDPIGQAQNVRATATTAGGNPEGKRLLLADMMNKLQISDTTKGSGEKPKKVHFSETKLHHGTEG